MPVAAAAAADIEAPFLWLRFTVVAVLLAPATPFPVPTAPPSAFRDGRDLELELELAAAASAKVAKAGVDGLLALPLFVLTAARGVGGTMGVAESRFGSRSSTTLAVLSFFPLLPLGAGGSGGGGTGVSVSALGGSVLIGMGTAVSFMGFGSVLGLLVPLLCVPGSGVPDAVAPLGLFEAAEAGRCRALSVLLDCAEFWRAREEAGRGGLGSGTGEHRPIFKLSGKVPMSGEDATDGDMAAFVLL